MLNVSADDANFAINNRERIKTTLEAVTKFLHASKRYDYYREGNRSAIEPNQRMHLNLTRYAPSVR